MIRPIVKLGNPVLETRAEVVAEFDTDLKMLIEDMVDSLYAARGIGLAAPQIGIRERVAVIDTSFSGRSRAALVLVNPELVHSEGHQVSEEACLSIPGFHAKVARPYAVAIRAQDEQGVWSDYACEALLARAVLHEIDHLDGTLYLSHLSVLKRNLIKRQVSKLLKAGQW